MRSLSLSFFFIVFIFFIHICWLYFTIKLIGFLWRIICDQRKAIECFFNSQSPINNWEYRNIISSQNWKKTHQFLWSKCTFCMLCALYVCQSMAFPYRIPSNEGQIVQSNTIFCPVNFVICTWSIKYDCFHGRNKNVNYFGSQIYLHSI